MEAELYLARTHAMQYVPGDPSQENQEFANKAAAGFESVLKKQPKNVRAMIGLAGVYQNSSDLGRAHDLYLQVAQLTPLDPKPFYAVGSVDWILAFDKIPLGRGGAALGTGEIRVRPLARSGTFTPSSRRTLRRLPAPKI